MSHPAPAARTSAERTWNLLRAAALIPWCILSGVCAAFWITVVLLGVIFVTESPWYPSADLLGSLSPLSPLGVLAFMFLISCATLIFRQRIVAFFMALAAALFICLYPRERSSIRHPAMFRSSYPPQNKSAA